MTSCSCSGSAASASSARRSERAALNSRLASSDSSGVNERPPFAKRAIHHGFSDSCASISLLLTENDHIDRHAKPSEDAAEADRFLNRVVDRRLNHQHVDIGALVRVFPRARAKQ